MSKVHDEFIIRSSLISDINEHLPTLKRYAEECQHITECGVRGCSSSYAFADGLRGRSNTKLIQYDIYRDPLMDIFLDNCNSDSVNVSLNIESDLLCSRENTDLLFIDTWHVYGQIKRELDYWNSYVKKYIIMHDTTVDEWLGEVIRGGGNPIIESQKSGIPADELSKGLWPAVEEFLKSHAEWSLHQRFTNNNGLTVLKRV
jgi:hypothetical protein